MESDEATRPNGVPSQFKRQCLSTVQRGRQTSLDSLDTHTHTHRGSHSHGPARKGRLSSFLPSPLPLLSTLNSSFIFWGFLHSFPPLQFTSTIEP